MWEGERYAQLQCIWFKWNSVCLWCSILFIKLHLLQFFSFFFLLSSPFCKYRFTSFEHTLRFHYINCFHFSFVSFYLCKNSEFSLSSLALFLSLFRLSSLQFRFNRILQFIAFIQFNFFFLLRFICINIACLTISLADLSSRSYDVVKFSLMNRFNALQVRFSTLFLFCFLSFSCSLLPATKEERKKKTIFFRCFSFIFP